METHDDWYQDIRRRERERILEIMQNNPEGRTTEQTENKKERETNERNR
jgi:hypothetical protein